MEKQQKLMEGGAMGTLLQPQHIYQAHRDWSKAWGMEPSLYWQDPAQLPPPQPKEPGVQEQLMMAQARNLDADAQHKMQSGQIEMQKAQLELQIKQGDWQYQEKENQMKFQLEQMKGQLAQMKASAEAQGKVASLEMEKDKQDLEVSIKGMTAQLDHVKSERDREVDVYKIQMDALTKQLQAYGANTDPAVQQAEQETAAADKAQMGQLWGNIAASVQELTERLTAMDEAQKAPRKIMRDAKGLMTQIGDIPVTRDASGRVDQIG